MLRVPQAFAPADEQAFLDDYCRRFAAHRRISLVFAVGGWGSYLGWDLLVAWIDPAMRSLMPLLFAIRLAAFGYLLFLLQQSQGARFGRDERYATRTLVAGCWVMFFASYLLMWLAPFPYSYLFYFFGVFMIMVFGAGPLHLRSREVRKFMLLASVFNVLYVLWYVTPSRADLSSAEIIQPWASIAFLVTLAVVGTMVSVQFERSERTSYLRQASLAEKNGIIERRNQAVEELVGQLRASRDESEDRWRALVAAEERLREDAEQRSRDKSTFLATAVHDLRQPIQAIGSALDPAAHALAQGNREGAGQMIELARRATDVMRNQLGAMLDLSRLESGLVKVDVRPVDAADVIRECLEEVRLQASSRGVAVECAALPAGPMAIRSDPQLIGRVLKNLLSNAVKYQDPARRGAGWVRLDVAGAGGRLRIAVSDNGIGIPERLLRSGAVFRPFAQYNNVQPEADKGVGLGLAIVRAVLALLPDHELAVDSEPGRGSTFTLTAPRADAAGLVGALPAPRPAAASLDGLYVLLVEDDELVRQSTAALLESAGVRVECSRSLDEVDGVTAAMERLPDALLCDFRLPDGKSALDVMKLIDERFGPVPLVVFTGEPIDFESIDAFKGIPVLRKPVPPEQLFAALDAAGRRVPR